MRLTKRKETILMKKMEVTEVFELIKSAKSIALFSHINPDCDTICSSLALRSFLMKLGKKVSSFCDGDLKNDMASLSGASDLNADTLASGYDLTISIDCATEDRLGKYRNAFRKGKHTLSIDHHLQDRPYAEYNLIDPRSGATAELIYLIIEAGNIGLMDREIASLLYTALVTDTGNFGFSNVGERTLYIASRLISYGIPNAEISFRHFREIPLSTFRLKMRVFSKIQLFEDNKIGIVTFTKEDFEATGTTIMNSSNLVSDVANISGLEIAISITEVHPNSYKVSIRTQHDVNANEIAMRFGGGGHKNAAGFMINGFYGNILDDILKACRDCL